MQPPIPELAVRLIRPSEFDEVGELCVRSYVEAGTAGEADHYVVTLRDVEVRASDEHAQVFVATVDNKIIGSITMCAYGSSQTRVCWPGEFEFRMLAVDPAYQHQGVASALIAACADRAEQLGLKTTVACVTPANRAGHHLYDRLGFVRRPDRDWRTDSDIELQVYTRMIQGEYCGRCGDSVFVGEHGPCQRALQLEPPRFCPQCRRRMVVQVTPVGWTATCSEHGDVTSPG